MDLHSNQLSSSGLDAIASPLLESKGELDVLDLSDNKIRSIDPDSSLLRLLKGCSRLTRLNLQHSLTTAREDDKVALFDCLASNRSIKWLDLSRNNIHSARSTEALKTAFEENPKLTSVSLCLLYTSPSPRDATLSRMPSSA